MKIVTPVNIIFVLWGFSLFAISGLYHEYVRHYLYLSIVVILPITTLSLFKQIKNDKIHGTKELQHLVNRIMILAVVFVIMFALTHQNHI